MGDEIHLNGIVTLDSLNDHQISIYLEKQPELWVAIEGDLKLKEMLRNPLLLSFFAFVYRDNLSASDRQELVNVIKNSSDVRDKILDHYLEKRYAHEMRRRNPQIKFSLEQIKD